MDNCFEGSPQHETELQPTRYFSDRYFTVAKVFRQCILEHYLLSQMHLSGPQLGEHGKDETFV